jgi:hypothetical protein
MRKLMTTLVAAFAVLAFASTARAQNDEAEVDWDEAMEFAEVTDTYVENNVEWVTYYDELQNVMWSQPKDATPEAVKAYFTGDRETLKDWGLDDLCAINWPVPNQLKYVDGSSSWTYYNDDFELYSSSSTVKKWVTDISDLGVDIDTSVTASVRNAVSYCGDFHHRIYYPNDGGYFNPDSSTCGTFLGVTYYSAYDESHIENWTYDPGGTYSHDVSRHRVFVCDAYRYVFLRVSDPPE